VRVCFLVHELGRSGGAETIRSYARALEESGDFEVDLLPTDPRAGERVAGARDTQAYDVAIATWWATAGYLWRVPAARRVVFLQSVESRFYEERHFFEQLAAEEVLSLPVSFVTVAHWIRDLLAELRPEAPCDVVLGGIDKSAFAPRPRPRDGGPLRILVDGQPSMWFKGVAEARASVRAMAEPAELTVVAGKPDDAGELDGARVVGGLAASEMADLYARSDVLVKLSRVESLGLTPIEAAHVGTPCVVTPYTGHEEHVVHGRNGLVVGIDDVPGTARALDRLARDGGLRARLSEGALESARDWPSSAAAADAFGAALRRIAERPAPDPEPALAALALARRHRLELTREHVRQAEAELQRAEGLRDWWRHAYDDARGHIDGLNAAMRDLEALVAEKDRLIEDIRSERAYRAAAAVRRVLLRRRA
jgi:glycosyltransferase involved in cell wall biosynthesis